VLARTAHAVLDTSDGLAEGARLLAEASGVRIEVDGERVPLCDGLARTAEGRLPSETFFGGDYELLAAIPPGRFDEARRAIRTAGGQLTGIGGSRQGRGARLREGARMRAMPNAGWRHFE